MYGFSVSICILMSVVVAGCGSNDRVAVYPAKAELFFQGEPAEGAFVALRPLSGVSDETPPAYGEVDDRGVVKFTTYEAFDGVPLGDYALIVTWYEMDDDENETERLNGRYLTPELSEIRLTTKTTGNDFGRIDLQ